MKMFINRMLFMIFLISPVIHAATDAERLVQKLNAIHTFKANFKEKLTSESHQISQTRGQMLIKRPGRLRWQSTSPVSQWVVANGREVWIYDVDLEQVTIKQQEKALRGTPALFLSDATDALTKDYQVQFKALSGKAEAFELQALSKRPAFESMILVFKGEQLQSMKLVDRLGQVISITFSQIVQNGPIPLSQFTIKLPRGVDVIRE